MQIAVFLRSNFQFKLIGFDRSRSHQFYNFGLLWLWLPTKQKQVVKPAARGVDRNRQHDQFADVIRHYNAKRKFPQSDYVDGDHVEEQLTDGHEFYCTVVL